MEMIRKDDNMDVFVELLKTCIPTIVGALIVIIPTAINKKMEINQKREEQKFQEKQQRYTKLITLFTKVLRAQKNSQFDDKDVDELIELINTINVTGGLGVINCLNSYVNTWGKEDKTNQNKAYSELVKAIRLDLNVDNKELNNFPQLGLIEINVHK